MDSGLIWNERYAWYDTGNAQLGFPGGLGAVQPEPFVEGPEPKRRLRNLLAVSGLDDQLVAIKPRLADEQDLLRWHTPEYVERIRELSAERGGDAGEVTPFGPGSYEIACLSVGGCLAAVDAVIQGTVRNAYALVRPPGHHAERDCGKGFCIFANIALAAMYARETHGTSRIAVVDWDVHHGNGTEHAFYSDRDVLTISLHQDNLYPLSSGASTDRGEGAGEGANLNIPLPPGSGTGAYLAALERMVLPAVEAFQPDLVFLASGFDASAYDPIGRMLLTSESFRQMTRLLVEAVDGLCDGRLVACHEGGYSSLYVPFCGLATIEELAGVRSSVSDPLRPLVDNIGGQELSPHQDAAIAAAAQSLGPAS